MTPSWFPPTSLTKSFRANQVSLNNFFCYDMLIFDKRYILYVVLWAEIQPNFVYTLLRESLMVDDLISTLESQSLNGGRLYG